MEVNVYKPISIVPRKKYNITKVLNFYYNLVNPIDLYFKINKIYTEDINFHKKEIILRIISGKARGTKLNTLEGLDTRPTLDRIKESLFNIMQNEIYNSKVLDLFAGSGTLGVEALIRGAKEAILCDNSYKAIQIIKENVKKTHFEKQSKIINNDYKKILDILKNEKFDIIFLDPPYESQFDIQALKIIIENDMLSREGIIVLETDNEKEKKENLDKLDINVYDLRSYGRVSLFFLNRKEK